MNRQDDTAMTQSLADQDTWETRHPIYLLADGTQFTVASVNLELWGLGDLFGYDYAYRVQTETGDDLALPPHLVEEYSIERGDTYEVVGGVFDEFRMYPVV